MTATNNHPVNNQPYPSDGLQKNTAKRKGKILNLSSRILIRQHTAKHHPNSGINPIVDAASRLFSILGKLHTIQENSDLEKLQKELISEIRLFQDTVSQEQYDTEYVILCRYILCASFDDIIPHTAWASQHEWEDLSLLKFFNADTQHQNMFFIILERVLKEPAHHIDVMELIYICLSLGYKGQYRGSEDSQLQLEQLSNTLYKHIRAQRGNFSKTLSSNTSKIFKSTTSKHSFLFIVFATACLIMLVFVGLDYLMDAISNEAYKNISLLQESTANHLVKNQG